jgi:hypothetical protein
MAKLKSLPGVKGLTGDGALRLSAPKPPDIPRTTGFAIVQLDKELARWVWLLGGGPDAIKLAKQCRSKQAEYPFATFPELLAMIWLDRKGIPYQAQPYVLGGRNRAGGVVPDILIPQGSGFLVISILGVYWHKERQNDFADRIVTLASTIQGLPVEAFVVIIEDDLYNKLDEVMTAAINGIEWHTDYS